MMPPRGAWVIEASTRTNSFTARNRFHDNDTCQQFSRMRRRLAISTAYPRNRRGWLHVRNTFRFDELMFNVRTKPEFACLFRNVS